MKTVLQKLSKVASMLDQEGLYDYANEVDHVMSKLAGKDAPTPESMSKEIHDNALKQPSGAGMMGPKKDRPVNMPGNKNQQHADAPTPESMSKEIHENAIKQPSGAGMMGPKKDRPVSMPGHKLDPKTPLPGPSEDSIKNLLQPAVNKALQDPLK